MKHRTLFFTCVVLLCTRGAISQTAAQHPKPAESVAATSLALTPPLGWNSWDGYGTTIREDQFKANADWFAQHLKPAGWQYVVVDMEWFVTNPIAEGNSKTSQFSIDPFGRYIPALNRFPSSADSAGLKPLADYAHSLGLKFGIHILRGIPKQAVEKNLPVAGSSYHAADAADPTDSCPWNPDNYGLDPHKPAAQAYYDSIARLYADWEVDLIKVDCIASRPYKGEEIRMLSEALKKTGRPIVLSLSPGSAPLDKVEEMRQYANMWRISDDIWDLWHSSAPYPQGLGDQFANVAKWAGLAQPGHWPDADMLPLGRLGPAPGWGQARETRLSHDEQRTLVTLWCIFPSPLMIGGELPSMNDWTLSLLTNPEVLAVDQHSSGNHPVIQTDKIIAWAAQNTAQKTAQNDGGDGQYLAIFNVGGATETLNYEWKDLGLAGKAYKIRDLWEHKDLAAGGSIAVTLPPHGSVLYRLSPVR
jgi:alpha-galactosidase